MCKWSFDEPGWRPLSVGVVRDRAYLWTARSLIVLPTSLSGDVDVVRVDEDLLFVFRINAGWLLVCETSVRLMTRREEAARFGIGEVIEYVLWQDSELRVRDTGGREYRLGVNRRRSGDPVLVDLSAL